MATSNAAPLRVAIIGVGGIGELRAAALTQLFSANPTLIKFVYAVDIDKGRAETVAAKYSAQASVDAFDVIARPDIDIVIVSTPPNKHGELTIAALDAKKHVICEKPLAHTLEDAERMCDAADRNGMFLKTGFNHRYFPPMQFARRLIDDGKLGEIVNVQAYAGHPGGVEFGHDWIHDGKVTGGGSLVDNGIHILDLTRFFFGDVVSGKGYISNLVWDFPDAEDNGFALFRNEKGRIAQVHSSWTHWRGYKFWVEIFGTKGYARAGYPPMLVEYGFTPQAGIRSKRRWEFFPKLQILERLKGWQFTITNSLADEMRDFALGIRAGKPTEPTGRDGLRAMQMAHAIYRSSREGVEVMF